MLVANDLIVILIVIMLFTLLNSGLWFLALTLPLRTEETHRCYLSYIRINLHFPKCFHFCRILKTVLWSGDI